MTRAVVLRGDAAYLPLGDESVDLIVTSPPYFGLRSYTDGGEHYDGQIGSEATPRAYLEALWRCTAEWVRVLKPSGSLFVNLGDSYSGGKRTSYDRTDINGARGGAARPLTGIAGKSLLGMPWRYALGCVDDLGLILRAEIIWDKPNGLPESVTDRVRRSHEQVFHFTRLPRYYSAVDEVREAHTATVTGRSTNGWKPGPSGNREIGRGQWSDATVRDFATSPLGKLPGSVWTIPSAPLTVPARLGVDHFAAYPPELVRRIILGWSPPAVCTACGDGRRPVVVGGRSGDGSKPHKAAQRVSSFDWAKWKEGEPHRITGYACACPDTTAPARPGVVLDPFGGTGTTALVASALGRTGITVDRSADYCRLAQWRTADPGERARALNVPKPPPVPDGQGELFGMAELAQIVSKGKGIV